MKIKFISMALALAMVLSLSLVTAVPAAADELPVGPAPKYQTIQSAIDAASPGDTIIVEPGTYAENITINKSDLTVVSVEYLGATIDASGVKDAVLITAPGVTLDGFNIVEAKYGVQVLHGVVDTTIQYNRFLNDEAMMAIYFNRGSGGWVEGNEIVNLRKGFGAQTDEAITVIDNLFMGCTQKALEFFDDDLIEGYGDFIINGNSFEENAIQVYDPDFILNLQYVLDNNYFDRAVVVRGSGIKVPTIFSGIQDAVDAATSGDTVDVQAGRYPTIHSIDILTDYLTIVGPNYNVNPVTSPGARGPEAVVELWALTYAFWVKDADFVTISGFTIDATNSAEGIPEGEDNHGYPDEGYSALGIGIGPIGDPEPSADDATVSNNIIFGTSDYAIGAYAANTPSHMISRLQVLNNLIVECKYGFMGGVGLSDSLIKGNAILDSYQTGEWGAIAFWGNIYDTDIVENYIADNALAGIYLGGGFYGGDRIERNEILGNGGPGIWVSSGAALEESRIYYNNLIDNADYGVLVSGSPIVDARYNWWGDMSGPYNPAVNPSGIGYAVSDHVNFVPWLTRPFQQALTENIAYFGLPLVHVNTGWNMLSTPIALDPACDTWAEYIELGDGLDINPQETSYYFDAEIQWYVQVLGSYQLTPCDAIMVNMLGPDVAAICYSPLNSSPSKDLLTGWNWVSLSAKHEMVVVDALDSIEEVEGGLKGYAQVVSPNMNQPFWTWVSGSEDKPPEMLLTKGYYVFMVNGGELAGFEFTPQTLPPESLP